MKYLFLFFSIIFCNLAVAQVTSSYVGKVAGIRIEGSSGLISLSSYLEDGNPRCNRVWVDLLKDEDKAAYSTFLMAFASDKTVHIRALQNGAHRYGACDFYDVYISRQ